MSKDRLKASHPKKSYVIEERSDVDPHEKFDPLKAGLEEWGENFYVEPEPVVVERDIKDGRIVKTTPLSEIDGEAQATRVYKDGELIVADPIQRMPKPQRAKDKTVHLMAGLLMRYYSSLKPGQIGFNPLYDGIPAKEILTDKWILQPEKTNAELVHVSAAEVHEWLKKLLAGRMQLINQKNKQTGAFVDDISSTIVRMKR